MIIIKSENLINQGYTKVDDFTYKKIDEETGMEVVLRFNRNGSKEENDRIHRKVFETIIRQDI